MNTIIERLIAYIWIIILMFLGIISLCGMDYNIKTVVIFLCIFLIGISPKKKIKGLIFCVAISFIVIFQTNPISDQWILVQTAEDMRNYNFAEFGQGGYIFRYPFQAGLVLFYYIISLFAGESNYLFLQLINLAAVFYLLRILCVFSREIYRKSVEEIDDKFYFAFLICYPLYLYILYIYGTLLGFALGMGSLYHLYSFNKKKNDKNIVISVALLVVSILIKPNGKIILVAEVLYLIYWWIKKEIKAKYVLGFVITFLALNFLGNQLVSFSIFHITGIELTKGMPMLGWIAMGLSEGGNAPGSYNGVVVNSFIQSGYNYELASQYAYQEIIIRLKYFVTHMGNAILFFWEKTLYQWGDPTFNSEKILNYGNVIHETSIVYKLISTTYLTLFAQIYQIAVIIGSICFAWMRKRRIQIEEMMLAVIFIGGFLFHLFWEASPSYTVTYFFLLIPYAVIGYTEILDKFKDTGSKLIQRLEHLRGSNKIYFGIIGVLLVCLVVLQRFILIDNSVIEVSSGIPNGYYKISNAEKNDSSITLENEEILLKKQENKTELTISYNIEKNTYQIRFYPSGKLLGIDENTQKVITYIDSIVNMEYTEMEAVEYEWQIEKIDNDQYYISQNDVVLAVSPNGKNLELSKKNGDKNQIWYLTKQ